VSVRGNVVIIDEAHNLLDTISSVYSIRVTGGHVSAGMRQRCEHVNAYMFISGPIGEQGPLPAVPVPGEIQVGGCYIKGRAYSGNSKNKKMAGTACCEHISLPEGGETL